MENTVTNTLAVVLGGGATEALWPLTSVRCRPAIPFGGQYRLIDITISNCINSDIPRVFVLTQYNSESLNRHVAMTYRFDRFTRGFIEILAAEQREDCPSWFSGSASAIRHVWHRIRRFAPKEVLVLPGEQIYKSNYRELIREHRRNSAAISLMAVPISARDASNCGLLRVNDQGEVKDFEEKPEDPERISQFVLEEERNEQRCLANMGIYLFDFDTLDELLRNEQIVQLGRDLLPSAVEAKLPIEVRVFDSYWENVNNISSFFNANLHFAERQSPINIHDHHRPFYTNPRFLPSTKLFSCNLAKTLVSDGCVIENSDLHNCVLGPRSFVRSGSTLKEVVMMGAEYFENLDMLRENAILERPSIGVGTNCLIEKAIIDKNVRIGKHVHIINKDHVTEANGEDYAIRDGIVVLRKNASILDGTVL